MVALDLQGREVKESARRKAEARRVAQARNTARKRLLNAAVARVRAIRKARDEVKAELAPVRRAYYGGDRSPGTVVRMETLSRRFNTLGQALAVALREKRRIMGNDRSAEEWRADVQRKWGPAEGRLARRRGVSA